ncbi:hypothetical protein KY361_00075 [Candidatus Woesearchaeota archaeon]|nr:hypothetical protein [Candidatus Woesearchaeota archaeon]
MKKHKKKCVAKLRTYEWTYWVREDGVIKRGLQDKTGLGKLVASAPNLDGFSDLERSSFGDYFAERLPTNAMPTGLPPGANPEKVKNFMLSLKREEHYILQDGDGYWVLPPLVEPLPH